MQLVEKTLLFVEPTALAFLLVYAYSVVSREGWMKDHVNIVMGVAFGLCAVVAMMNPIPIVEGVIVDIRALFVGAAAAFFGIVGGAIALSFGLITRFSIGGDGAAIGMTSMTIAMLMGLAWAAWVRPRMQNPLRSFLVLGAMISVQLGLGLMLADGVREVFFYKLAPVVLVSHLIGAPFLGMLIARERVLLDEQKELKNAVSVDPLTQLMNRQAALSQYAALENGTIPSKGIAMLCIDVDHFKSINDTHGHLRGDQVLVEIARRMKACLRPDDIFARMSGDEFVIVLNDLMADQARAVADRCQNSISAYPMIADGAEIDMSVSVGCTWVAERPDFLTLRTAADTALYRAKRDGRDRLAFDKVARLLSPIGPVRGHQAA
ncbi:GGDEF domain-containing protein [Yoonia sp. 2307UL14-13]|uniref:GGDEF domain-containing protein n=1 Tax=Yoonia sp. 2307UL14-13 TaxID=3126506 RepID=UPI0030B52E16